MTKLHIPSITLNDGTKMPQLGLGVWKAEDGKEVESAVKTAIQAGYRLIDTAAVYGNEKGVGNAIRESGVSRDELFVTTKLWNSDQGTGKARPALEASLEKLQLDYVDLYLVHWPMPAKDLYVETWKELEQLRSEGLVKSIGVCNFNVEHLERLKNECDITPSVNQIELHPNFPQNELRTYGKENGIHIESWSPIGGSQGTLLDDEAIQSIAKVHGKSPAQVVIRWHIQNGLIVIPKSTNESRIKENIDVFDFELSYDEMAVLNALENGKRQGPNPDTFNNA